MVESQRGYLDNDNIALIKKINLMLPEYLILVLENSIKY